MEGIVKWYNRKKGFGFIKGDDEVDYFVHYSALAEGTFIRDEDRVSFEPADTDKGKQAKNVKLLQKASEISGRGPSEKREKPQVIEGTLDDEEDSYDDSEDAREDSEDF
ncbi:cold shock domain-containing protein [Candidatus Woesearchaeota archaeon]|nr:cold shock domain-containing protein [Candidatus Woesearchaeota archaeon]